MSPLQSPKRDTEKGTAENEEEISVEIEDEEDDDEENRSVQGWLQMHGSISDGESPLLTPTGEEGGSSRATSCEDMTALHPPPHPDPSVESTALYPPPPEAIRRRSSDRVSIPDASSLNMAPIRPAIDIKFSTFAPFSTLSTSTVFDEASDINASEMGLSPSRPRSVSLSLEADPVAYKKELLLETIRKGDAYQARVMALNNEALLEEVKIVFTVISW